MLRAFTNLSVVIGLYLLIDQFVDGLMVVALVLLLDSAFTQPALNRLFPDHDEGDWEIVWARTYPGFEGYTAAYLAMRKAEKAGRMDRGNE